MDLLPASGVLFDTVLVPSAVVRECLDDLSKPVADTISTALTNRLLVEQPVTNREYCDLLAEILGAGEAETLTLAKEKNALALLDEAVARRIALQENVDFAGSLSVLIRAKQKKLIPTAIPLLNRLVEHGYYLDKSLIRYVADTCGETFVQKPEQTR